MLSLNWLAVVIVIVANFVLGAVWFSVIFGKLWMRIHHGDRKIPDTEMRQSEQDMWKILIPEFAATALMIVGLALMIRLNPAYSEIHNAAIIWFFYILPSITSSVLWGNDAKKWMLTKITISASYRLIALILAGYVFSIWI